MRINYLLKFGESSHYCCTKYTCTTCSGVVEYNTNVQHNQNEINHDDISNMQVLKIDRIYYIYLLDIDYMLYII